MRKPRPLQTAHRLPAQETGRPRHPQAPVPRLSEELVALLPGCVTIPHHRLTRGELAQVFGVSARTIDRRQRCLRLPAEHRNARVLRYSVEAVVLLCALGHEMDRAAAERLKLVPDAILAVAAQHSVVIGRKPQEKIQPSLPVLFGESEEDRTLIRLWLDPLKHEALAAVVRAMAN